MYCALLILLLHANLPRFHSRPKHGVVRLIIVPAKCSLRVIAAFLNDTLPVSDSCIYNFQNVSPRIHFAGGDGVERGQGIVDLSLSCRGACRRPRYGL